MFKPQKKPKGFGENNKGIESNNFNLKLKLQIKKELIKSFLKQLKFTKKLF